MENLYERLIRMLGKPVDDPCFDRLIQDVGEKPKTIYESKSHVEYSFKSLGIFVVMDKRQNLISSVFLHIATAMVEAGNISPYGGNMPAAISSEDDRFAVKQKLGLEPRSKRIQGRTEFEPKNYWEYYFIEDLEHTFIFDGTNGRMHALSVHCAEEEGPSEPPPAEPETFVQTRCNDVVLKALAFAQAEAHRTKHNFIGSEFLLLGLYAEPESVSATALCLNGLTLEKAREEITEIIGFGKGPVSEKSPYTYGAKRALEIALQQADRQQIQKMNDAHLLFGLIEGEGVATRVLENLQVDIEKLREEIILLSDQENKG